jgi:hypothetical protein
MDDAIPAELTEGAILRDREYAWEVSALPIALQRAPNLGYACLGGQFWFLLQDGSVYEPFWLEANPADRDAGEPWSEYAHRSCAEVLTRFAALAGTTDFDKKAGRFRSIESSFRLMFNAYFVTEQQFLALGLEDEKPRG